ncbi:MAG TPA: phosphotransferase [Mobilitalea sp.]|nr:phosphotransferase [Mobilitalea sp.]
MKSNTKNLLSEEQIKRLVKVNFGDSCEVSNIVELKGGMFNSAYLIERSKEKDKIVLKVSLAPGTRTLTYEQDPMPTEVEVYKLVSEKTHIPAPRILSYDFSKKHIPSNYFFMTALEGVAMNKVMKQLSKDNLEKIKMELASYFAQLHQIKGNYFGYFTDNQKYQYQTWKEAFLHMMDMILQDGRTHKVKLPYDRIEQMLQKKAVYLENIKEPALIDYDLWPGNIFLKKDGDQYVIEGIIDFERAFWGDPFADFPPAFMLIKGITNESNFWKAYSEAAMISPNITKEDEIRLSLYALYIWTIMAMETFRYGFLYSFIQGSLSKSFVMKHLKELEQE